MKDKRKHDDNYQTSGCCDMMSTFHHVFTEKTGPTFLIIILGAIPCRMACCIVMLMKWLHMIAT